MPQHSVADAKAHLSELIDRALAGEAIVITRHGTPVVALKPVARAPGPVSEADIAWLASQRVGRKPADQDAGALLEQLRDDDER
jgi:prevent-host-death family protein